MARRADTEYTIRSFPDLQLHVTVKLSNMLKLRVKLAIFLVRIATMLLGGTMTVDTPDD